MNYRILLTLLLTFSIHTMHAEENSTNTQKVAPLDSATRFAIIDLYELLRTIEDDLDRLSSLNRSNKEIETIRALLETKKLDTLEKLSAFKGFENLTAYSHKHRFTSKADYTLVKIASCILVAIGVSALLLATINIPEKTLNLPTSKCARRNIADIEAFMTKVKEFLLDA